MASDEKKNMFAVYGLSGPIYQGTFEGLKDVAGDTPHGCRGPSPILVLTEKFVWYVKFQKCLKKKSEVQ